MLEQLSAQALQFSFISIQTLIILLGASGIYLAVSHALRVLEKRRHLPPRLIHTFRIIARWMVGLAAVILLLQSWGVLHSVFAAVSGLLALVAIGFVAVWSVLSNTLCSLILLVVRPFRVGDTLTLPPDDLHGRVVNFNFLFTTLETADGLQLQIPNNMFFQRPVLRKKGTEQICLTDQLYREQNAKFGRSGRPEPSGTAEAVALRDVA